MQVTQLWVPCIQSLCHEQSWVDLLAVPMPLAVFKRACVKEALIVLEGQVVASLHLHDDLQKLCVSAPETAQLK